MSALETVKIENWQLLFATGEREARLASGEWTGRTLADFAQDRIREHGDAVAFHGENGTLTFNDAHEQATALARALRDLGIQPGETISFQLPNWLETVVIDLACVIGGYVINPIIPIYRHAELRFILRDARSRVLFIPGTFRGIDYPQMIAELQAELPELQHVIVLRDGDAFQRMVETGRRSDAALAQSDPDAAKLVMYTSGTTGQPKGVIYSHNQGQRSLRNSYAAWDLQPGSRLLMPSPVTHVTGFSYGMEMPFLLDTRTVFMEKWDAAQALDLILEHEIEFMIGATPFLAELVEQAQKRGTSLPSLKIFACGGAAVPQELVRKAATVLTNCRTFRVFGSSEMPMVTQGVLDDLDLAASSDGRIYDWDIKVVDEMGKRLPFGREGEILGRGPAMFRGYTNPANNMDAFDEEGYFRSGDLGVVTEDGIITITGRKKDIIIRGGENLSAKEIEDALHEHPAVRIASVVAMPHERLGEGVCAYVVVNDGDITAADLTEHLKTKGLARQKWPERFEFVDALPTTASGKIQKHVLRSMISEKVKAAQGSVS